MMEIIRTDKSDGSQSPETVERLTELISLYYPSNVRATVLSEVLAGEREFNTEFAIYRRKDFVPFSKRGWEGWAK